MDIRENIRGVIELHVKNKLLLEFPKEHIIHKLTINEAIIKLQQSNINPGLMSYLISIESTLYHVNRIGE